MSLRNNVWPAYRSHDDARCFSVTCGALLDPATRRPSGQPHGRGEFQGLCPKCGLTTWYDIEGVTHDSD